MAKTENKKLPCHVSSHFPFALFPHKRGIQFGGDHHLVDQNLPVILFLDFRVNTDIRFFGGAASPNGPSRAQNAFLSESAPTAQFSGLPRSHFAQGTLTPAVGIFLFFEQSGLRNRGFGLSNWR